MRPASEIFVNQFDVTLLWPVLISETARSRGAAANTTDGAAPDLNAWAALLGTAPAGEFGPWVLNDRKYPLPINPALQMVAREAAKAEQLLTDDDLEKLDDPQLKAAIKRNQERGDNLTSNEIVIQQLQQSADEYSEFVYFHPFVRRFLYGDKNSDDHAREMLVLEKPEMIDRVVRWEWPNGSSMQLRIRQVQLNLFRNGVGVLALKLDTSDPKNGVPMKNPELTLDTILKFMDHARRVYMPYLQPPWLPEDTDEQKAVKRQKTAVLDEWSAGKCPLKVSLSSRSHVDEAVDDNNMCCSTSLYADPGTLHYVSAECEPWTIPFWQGLLFPLLPQGIDEFPGNKPTKCGSAHNGCGLHFQQLVDERVPLMAHISVDDPRSISEADWMRLAWLDEPGNSEIMAYAPELSRRQFDAVRYDRFWDATGNIPADANMHTTRWLCSGYGFVGVGGGWFFENILRMHFRHHYFRLFLIAHFQKASLLAFENQLSKSLADLNDPEGEDPVRRKKFEADLNYLQLEMVQFRSRYWFSEVTSQYQGQEMFEMITSHLKTEKLFQEVYGEMQDSNGVVNEWAQQQQTQATIRLTVVAVLFLVVVPLLEAFREHIDQKYRVTVAAAILLFSFLLGILKSDWFDLQLRRFTDRRYSNPFRKWFGVVLIVIFNAGAVWFVDTYVLLSKFAPAEKPAHVIIDTPGEGQESPDVKVQDRLLK